MKLERNVKANERTAITRHISRRQLVIGKPSRFVRVRGHRIDKEKLARWMKDFPPVGEATLESRFSRKYYRKSYLDGGTWIEDDSNPYWSNDSYLHSSVFAKP